MAKQFENAILDRFVFTDELREVIQSAPKITVPESRDQIIEMAMGNDKSNKVFEVAYDVDGVGRVVEATVTRCKNGVSINYLDSYMRRRDPNCLLVGDDKPTDKVTYKERFGKELGDVRTETFEWLKKQNLVVMPFMSGDKENGYPSVLVAPDNAGFFVGGLADLQGCIPANDIPEGFKPQAVIYLAPSFRHTHFDGKQVVVHNRRDDMHEIFSYNLYPGPSAKKGIYGVLLTAGEKEDWITAHASSVKVVTPYDNILTIMHEGASGGGKSEMLEQVHREMDGTIKLTEHTVLGEKNYIELKETCELYPVTDDMALCHPMYQNGTKKLVIKDAEEGWFLRIDHITKYGTDPHYEKLSIHPKEPLIFLNIQGAPDATCLIWEHTMDAPNKPCPNPRVIMPRRLMPDIVNDPIEVDIRSFGVRTPPCTKENPSYGIMGFFHVLPPSLAWLWRLVAPRGHANPSITDTEGMTSEGVGSYWPFATGKMATQANLLLKQVMETTDTRYILIPNQHVGVYKVGFMPEWITREYLARRGSAKFRPEKLTESRCSLLGYSLQSLKVDGVSLGKGLLQTNLQPEIGNQGYDQGAKMLSDFFKKELEKFLSPDLDPLGREIIECCMNDGTIEDYLKFIPIRF